MGIAMSGEIMPKGDMHLLRRYVLVQRYKMDSGYAYECTAEELNILRSELGELEPIVDAINVFNGASVEQRAEDIGCSPEDFDTQYDNTPIVQVEELIEASKIPWEYGE